MIKVVKLFSPSLNNKPCYSATMYTLQYVRHE